MAPRHALLAALLVGCASHPTRATELSTAHPPALTWASSLLSRAGAALGEWRFAVAPARHPPSPPPHLAAASLLLSEARLRLDALEATILGPLKLAANASSEGGAENAAHSSPTPPQPASASAPPALLALAALAALSYAAAASLDAFRTAAGPAVSAALTLARAPSADTPSLPPVRTRARRAWRALRPAGRDCAQAATRLASHGVLIVALARHLAAAGNSGGSGLGAAAGWLLSAFPGPSSPAAPAPSSPSPGQAMLLCAAAWAVVLWAAADAAWWAEEAGWVGWAREAAGGRLGGRGAPASAPPTPAAPAPATPTGAALAALARARFGADAGRRDPAPPLGGWCTPLGVGTPAAAAGSTGPFSFNLRAFSGSGGGWCWGGGSLSRPRRRHSAGADGGDDPPPATRVRLPPPRPSPPPPAAACCSENAELPACRICWVAPRAVAFLPCGHVGACAGCTLRLFEAAGGGGGVGGGERDTSASSFSGVPCPFCGQAVADVARVFVV